MAAEDDRGRYLLGHADDELVRLERQALLFAEATEEGLRRAGLKPGMRVLDLGCGVGDVTLAAARIVGPEGSVLGIDTSAPAVATANRRFAALGVANARCREENIFTVETTGYDAIVGRFLLMHLPDPATLLDRLKGSADAGTIIAFLEMDIGSSTIVPPMALFQTAVSAICDVYRSGGAEPDMGSKLYAAFRKARLAPRLQGSCRVVSGDDGDVFDYLAGSVASLAPAMQAAGIKPAELDPTTLRGRLAEEVARADHCISFPRFVCAWAST